MIVCTNCGEENPARFRLCGFCGTPLPVSLPVQEVRKTVSGTVEKYIGDAVRRLLQRRGTGRGPAV